MVHTGSVAQMWDAFASACPDLVGPRATYSSWHFCDNQADADELAELVRVGRKRATSGAFWSYAADKEPLPRVGDFSVITDWQGDAQCVIRTTVVEVVPFEAVSAEFAAAEGEGDGSLEQWREAHWAAFERELARGGRSPQLDMPVVCERFDVVWTGR